MTDSASWYSVRTELSEGRWHVNLNRLKAGLLSGKVFLLCSCRDPELLLVPRTSTVRVAVDAYVYFDAECQGQKTCLMQLLP